jgi:uroporphyrin-III C-methyltransferase
MQYGFVSIVGAGPGSVDHLTLKAAEVISTADVILFDALISKDIQSLFPIGVMAVYCGKRCGQHVMTQSEINSFLIKLAKKGKRVVRLKGGDPFVFGRGSEEAIALRDAGVRFEIVPGLSSFNAVGALAGIPVTHRGISRQVRILEGHSLDENFSEWQDLTKFKGTTVIFMASRKLHWIATQYIKHGAPTTTPVALIESGNHIADSIQISTLGQVARQGLPRKTPGPGIIYIGEVVSVSELISPASKGAHHEYMAAHFS